MNEQQKNVDAIDYEMHTKQKSGVGGELLTQHINRQPINACKFPNAVFILLFSLFQSNMISIACDQV